MAITPSLRVGYDYEADDRNPAVALVAADGTGFLSNHLRFDRSDAVIAPELRIDDGALSFFAAYTAELSGNWSAQTATAGIRFSL